MGKGIEWIDIVRTAYEEFDVFPKGTVAQLEAELETEKAAYRIMNGLYEYRVGMCAQLEAENKWMLREVERVGVALYTTTGGHYTGTEEDLHYIGQMVEGVCETNLRLMNIEAEITTLEDECIRLEDENDDLRTKLVASEELYISRGIEIVKYRKLAYEYIIAYEELAFGGER